MHRGDLGTLAFQTTNTINQLTREALATARGVSRRSAKSHGEKSVIVWSSPLSLQSAFTCSTAFCPPESSRAAHSPPIPHGGRADPCSALWDLVLGLGRLGLSGPSAAAGLGAFICGKVLMRNKLELHTRASHLVFSPLVQSVAIDCSPGRGIHWLCF